MFSDQCTFRYSDDAMCVFRGREVEDNRKTYETPMCDAHRIISLTRARYNRNAADKRARKKAS